MSQIFRRGRNNRLDDSPADDHILETVNTNGQQRAVRADTEPTSVSFPPQRAPLVRSFSDVNSRIPATLDSPPTFTSEPVEIRGATDPLGLTLIHSPPEADLDFIFVHGLGGTSMKTWSYKHNVRNFWPLWLPAEPELSHSRIFSFGYNANFRGSSTSLNITDFAKDLLMRMFTFEDLSRNGDSIRIGQHPLVFVVHSMGGLVVKKAYIWGKQDEKYSPIISKVRGIAFLATPHRGASYAKILNSILESLPFGTSKKQYVSQLETTSSSIQDINDQFRTICTDLMLFSFYETYKTTFARGLKATIVEKSSAVLDYPQEQSSPLYADHHNVCKFENPRDENYINIRNTLRFAASKLSSKKGNEKGRERRAGTVDTTKRLEGVLGIRESSEQHLKSVKARMLEGSCQWILRKQSFQDWVDGTGTDSPILWLSAPPAAGKSTLASFIIGWIRYSFLDTNCQFHFFVSENQAKRKIAYFMRVIAFQLAQSHEIFRDALFRLHDETDATFDDQSPAVIWERIFEGILFRTPIEGDIFWVLDAIDEADAAIALCSRFLKARSVNRIKILITSRWTKELSQFLNGSHSQIKHEQITLADTYEDIRAFVSQSVYANLPQDEETRDEVIEQILDKANGSFLWVRLTLDSIRDNWHTQADLRKVLLSLPKGMEPLYKRMLDGVLDQNQRNCEIAQEILTWAVCSFRPLRISELQAALQLEFERFVSLADTVIQLCGNFVNVINDHVMPVHATARSFLLDKSNGFIDKRNSNEHLALACLNYLSDDHWRRTFSVGPRTSLEIGQIHLKDYAIEHPFLDYAIHHWAFHVANASYDSDSLLDVLDKFFRAYVLSWIHGVVLSGHLKTLARTAQYIRVFVHRKAAIKSNTDAPPLSFRVQDTQWLRLWAVDLIRLLGKFGETLLQEPKSIYRLIPILCPQQSQIGQIYGTPTDLSMSLTGLSNLGWNDCLARVGGSDDESISRVLATETHFVLLLRVPGSMIVFSTVTCAELRRMAHGEYVTHWAINKLGTMLVTAGIRTIRTWEVSTGQQLHNFPRNSEATTIAVAFEDSGTSIVICRDDYSIARCELESGIVTSTFWACNPSSTPQSCPKVMALSPHLGKVALVERGKAVLIWDRDRPQITQPWRCVWTADKERHMDGEESWTPPEVVRWHPDGTSIFVLYFGGSIVHWKFTEDICHEFLETDVREMVISKDGSLMLTGDHHGTVSVQALPRMNTIYKLHSEDLVRDLGFSPDGQRIYVSRGTFCDIWEPDVLVRHEEMDKDDTSSNYESTCEQSLYSDPVIAPNENNRSQVTAMTCCSEAKFYCCGKDDGSVKIHDAVSGEKLRKVYNHSSFASVIALAWSKSGKYIVTGDDAGRVICKRLEAREKQKWSVFPMFDIRLKEPIFQILFHPDEHLVLISTQSTDIIWSIRGKAKKEVTRRTWTHFKGRRWTTNPENHGQLLWIEPDTVAVFTWEDLELVDGDKSCYEEEVVTPDTPEQTNLCHTFSGTPDVVRCISSTRNNRQLIAEVVPNTGTSRSLVPRNIRVVHLIANAKPASSPPFARREQCSELASRAARIVGFFQGHVLFVDTSFWVCTWNMGDTEARGAKKHFFLPRDWVSPSSLALVTCNSEGTVFCPRNGEVAIVRNGIRL